MLTELEKKVIAAIQGDIPITQTPFLEIAKEVGVSEASVMETLEHLSQRGIIRRFGATLRHQKSGFKANAMVAWEVEEDCIDQVGQKMADAREVSHCYRRNPNARWPYNLYTMIHAVDEDSCREIAGRLSRETGQPRYKLLFSKKELKKTSMKYFTDSLE
jgi:DNA-binding Lrp family transcriptional regulator